MKQSSRNFVELPDGNVAAIDSGTYLIEANEHKWHNDDNNRPSSGLPGYVFKKKTTPFDILWS